MLETLFFALGLVNSIALIVIFIVRGRRLDGLIAFGSAVGVYGRGPAATRLHHFERRHFAPGRLAGWRHRVRGLASATAAVLSGDELVLARASGFWEVAAHAQ